MEILLGGLIVLVLVLGVALLRLQRQNHIPTAEAPSIDSAGVADELSRTVRTELAHAMNTLADRSTKDREEALKLGADLIARAGGEQLGKRADIIDTSMKAMQDSVTGRLSELNLALQSLRSDNDKQLSSVETAVTALAKRTENLTDILSNSQKRGQWGERLAEDMLRAAGFVEGVNYEKQKQIEGGGRPDYRFDMPPDRVLFMDVKFPLDKYAEYISATDEGLRSLAKDAFIRAVRGHVDTLTKRDYIDKATENALDYVLMFVPNESISAFVHEASPDLIDWALDKKVVLCSPLTLYAFLVVVRQASDSFHTEKTAVEIMQQIKKFENEFDKYTKAIEKVKKNFTALTESIGEISVGGTRHNKLSVPVRDIDNLRKRRGIPELEAADDDIIDAELDDE